MGVQQCIPIGTFCQQITLKSKECHTICLNTMTKDERIGIRVPREVKSSLQEIAKREGRSLAQICEVLLRGGIQAYEREGSKFVQRFISYPITKDKK